jgi:hypothetical protein
MDSCRKNISGLSIETIYLSIPFVTSNIYYCSHVDPRFECSLQNAKIDARMSHTFTYMIDFDYVVLETKTIAFRQTIVHR